VGLALAVALAFVVAPEASSEPDGLEKVAIDEGFVDGARDHDLADSPTADYGVRGVDDAQLSTGLAGALGIGVTFLVTGGLVLLVRRRHASASPT
jgi:cobalt/nickel transport system permease protein